MKQSNLALLILLILALGIRVQVAQSAPCCAGSAASPSIISGDDRAQLAASFAHSSVIGDAPDQGMPVFRGSGDDEITRTYRIDAAMLIDDRWQWGGSFPIVQREMSRFNSQASGLGDFRLDVAYEVLPEWTYSEWRPKGYAFIQIVLPTGRSIYESKSSGAIDATGKGFYTLALGSLWLKRWSYWDVSLIPEFHIGFSRSFVDSQGEVTQVNPGVGASAAIGVGYSPSSGALRMGLRLQPTYDQGKRIESSQGESVASYQMSWDAGLEASYLISESWSANAGYTDQTLFGPAVNTSLSRTVALGAQYHWPR